MTKNNKKVEINEKELALEVQIVELTTDLQRTRADFENYCKRAEVERVMAREAGQASAIMKLLPVIDNIERAINYIPEELKDNEWAKSVAGLSKNLDKSLEGLQLKRIEASPGTVFNPDLHEAIQFEDDAIGEQEVIADEMQAGYTLGGRPIRHAMVKVTRR